MDLDLTRPFTRVQAHDAGISDGRLRGAEFVQVFHGVYVARTVTINVRVRAAAALLVHAEGAVLSGTTAAEVLGLPVPADPVVHVAVNSSPRRRKRPGIASVVDAKKREEETVAGLPVVTGTRLFLQLADRLTLIDLVIVGDAMVRRGMVSIADLHKNCQLASGRGVLLARRAAGLVRERVDSPMETRLRLLLVLAGFPEPLVNPTIDGRYRTDLCWAALRLVLEYDGRHHRDDLDQWDDDIERNEWFEQHDWLLVHVVARDVFKRPDELIARIHAAYLRRGGARFRQREDWRAHFPVVAELS